jgi:spermidine synthase
VGHDRGRARAGDDRQIVLLIFMASGLAGLVYEVVWARQLVLVFGNTTQAISAILTGFFGGMAIGSVLGGRIADRVRSPLRMYAFLELLVVLAVLATQVWFGGIKEVYGGAFEALSANPTALALVRFALALAALGPATVFMGATLPTLSRYLVRHHGSLGHEFGLLYMVNTLGAIYGALFSGVFLIELLGLRATLLVGVVFSGAAGVAALLLSRRPHRQPDADEPAAAVGSGDVSSSVGGSRRARPMLALAVAFVSGLTSLGYQNLWNRLLAVGTGARSYVFTAILIVFLVGITVGAYLFSRYLHRTRYPVAVLAGAEVLLGALVLATLGIEADVYGQGVLLPGLLIVVAPAALVMGIVFPMSSMLVADSDDRVGTSAGLLLGSNTLGAICGSFVVPFFLMPALTSPRVVVLIAAVNAVTGLVLFWKSGLVRRRVRWAGRGAAAAVSAAAVIILIVPTTLVADAVVNEARSRGDTVTRHAEDEIAAVQAVRQQDGSARLFVGGNNMTVLTIDARMMADLPLMARPDAVSMCDIAFGMGGTYRTAIIGGLKVDAVELVPSVPQMFDQFYPDADQIRSNPNGHIYVADGRNFIALTRSTYDLIVVDPPPPMDSSGTGVLYSQEFYQASRERLNEGGLMAQWVLGAQTVDEMRSHVRTYASVFRHVTLAFGIAPGLPGVLMLGSDEPIDVSPEAIHSVLDRPGVLDDLKGAPDSPAGVETADQWQKLISDTLWIDDDRAREFGAGGALITDDHPYTEYNLLRHSFAPESPTATPEALLAAMPRSLP